MAHCPHTCGGGPLYAALLRVGELIVPTPVGVDRFVPSKKELIPSIVPTPVGVDRRKLLQRTPLLIVPTPVGVDRHSERGKRLPEALSPRLWGWTAMLGFFDLHCADCPHACGVSSSRLLTYKIESISS